MWTKRKSNVVLYVIAVFLFVSACIATGPTSGIKSTRIPFSSNTPTIETIATSKLTPSPTVAAGSRADFYLFASKIAMALQEKNTSFFDDYATSSTWNCLGDETSGVCKDTPSGATLTGIPVTYGWSRYEVQSLEDYKSRWQATFAKGRVVKLVAVANQFGDNPLMPMAEQSFLAILDVTEDSNPSIHEVRVLFFEYYAAWHLAGELITTEDAGSWLNDTCSTCYDTWTAWPK